MGRRVKGTTNLVVVQSVDWTTSEIKSETTEENIIQEGKDGGNRRDGGKGNSVES